MNSLILEWIAIFTGLHLKALTTRIIVFLFALCLSFSFALSQDFDSLALRIAFLDDPPYQSNWLPRSDTHFRIELSICNTGSIALAVNHFAPCNDCNPKISIEEVKTGKELERTRERDVLYLLDDRLFYDLDAGNFYTDTIDFGKYIDWEFSEGVTYRVWLSFSGYYYIYRFKDTTRTSRIWRGKIFSDTLEFNFD